MQFGDAILAQGLHSTLSMRFLVLISILFQLNVSAVYASNSCEQIFATGGDLLLSQNETDSGNLNRNVLQALNHEDIIIEYKNPNHGQNPSWIARLEDSETKVLVKQVSVIGARNEVSAYLLSSRVGFNIFPPTTLRKLKGKNVIVQVFIEGARKYDETLVRSENAISYRTDLFEHLIDNSDFNEGNVLYSEALKKEFYIDAEGAFNPDKIDHLFLEKDTTSFYDSLPPQRRPKVQKFKPLSGKNKLSIYLADKEFFDHLAGLNSKEVFSDLPLAKDPIYRRGAIEARWRFEQVQDQIRSLQKIADTALP